MRALTKETVTKIAYMLGINESLIKENYADALDTLEFISNQKEARIINILCSVRNTLMDKKSYVDQQIKFNLKNLDTINHFNKEDIKWLQRQGIQLIRVNTNAMQYLLIVNKLITEHINACKGLFPDWIKWDYIRNLFIIQGCTSSNATTAFNAIKNELNKYLSKQKLYPFQAYMNWNPQDNYGNVLSTDRKFITLLYQMNGEVFYDNSKVMDAADTVKNTIYDFINRNNSTAIIVDCENSDVYKLYSVLKNLNEEEISKIKKVILYDDYHTTKAWKLLEQLVNIKVEYIDVERIHESKSLVDIKMTAGACKEYYENNIESFILVSSDSDFWGLISSLPNADFLVMIEYDKCGDRIKEKLKEHKIYYCAIDDFCRGNIDHLKNLVLKNELYEKVESFNKTGIWPNMDSKEFIDELYTICRIEPTTNERKNFVDKYIKTLSFKINEEGRFYVCISEQ